MLAAGKEEFFVANCANHSCNTFKFVMQNLKCVDFIFIIFFNSDASTIGLIKYRSPYPFGVDPTWHGSRSELPFLNSLKMKMSILLGITQMNVGIILSYFNAKYFKNSVDIR